MFKNIYRPILDDDHHLVNSKKNPDRVRGLSRNSDNKDQRIPEWKSAWNELITAILGALLIGTILGAILKEPFIKSMNGIKNWFRGLLRRQSKKQEQLCDLTTDVDYSSTVTNDDDVKFFMTPSEYNNNIINYIQNRIALAQKEYIMQRAVIVGSDSEPALVGHKVNAIGNELANSLSAELNTIQAKHADYLTDRTKSEIESLLGGGYFKEGCYVPISINKILRELVS